MKTRFLISLMSIVLIASILGCGARKDDSAGPEDTSREWKEMDDYHMVMAESFHPYKDSADLAPAKAKASELAASAERWAKAKLPAKVDNDEMRGQLDALSRESQSLAQLVQNGTDEAIGEQLTKVHNLFHHIQELWYGGEHGHDHQH